MATFNGKNKLKNTKDMFNERLKYMLSAYDEEVVTEIGKNFQTKNIKALGIAEKQYYGHVDLHGNTIVPDRSKMKLVTLNKETIGTPRVFDFVGDMFVTVKTNIEYCKLNNIFDVKISELSDLNLVKTFDDPIEKYRAWISGVLYNFNNRHIYSYGEEKIMNYKQYVEFLLQHIVRAGRDMPMTLSGWMVCAQSSIYNTGLGLDISEDKSGTDNPKVTKFIQNESYDYYKDILINTGFSHAFQAPWNWVVDLKSPAMDYYYNKYNINSIEDLFEKYYIKTKYLDINLLKEQILKYYNLFVDKSQPKRSFSFSTCPKPAKDGIRKTSWNFQNRMNIDAEQADEIFSDQYWLTFYLNCRNLECGSQYEPGKLKEINDSAIKIQKKLDKVDAIDYINDKMKRFIFKRDWGYIDIQRRLKGIKEADQQFQKNIEKISFDIKNDNF